MTTNPSKKLDGFSWNFKGKVGRAPNFFLNLHHIQCLHTDNQHPSTKTGYIPKWRYLWAETPPRPQHSWILRPNPCGGGHHNQFSKHPVGSDLTKPKIRIFWMMPGGGGVYLLTNIFNWDTTKNFVNWYQMRKNIKPLTHIRRWRFQPTLPLILVELIS